MFEVGDRVQVNLGANGTHKGTVQFIYEGGKVLHIRLDKGNLVTVDPWDVFLVQEETE